MGEILLGPRRASRPGRILRRIGIVVVVMVGAFLIGLLVFHRTTTYTAPRVPTAGGALVADGPLLRLGAPGGADQATLERLGGLWVLRASGSPSWIGVASGRLLAGEIAYAQ